MSTRVTLIPETAATAPDACRDIARGFKLARRWQQQGKRHEAEPVPCRILTLEPKYFGSLCGLDAVYKQQGRRQAALFRRAATRAPGSPAIHTDLGVILANRDQPEEAVTCFEKALSDPDAAQTHNHRAQRPLTPTSSIAVRQPIYRHAVGRWRRRAREREPLLEAIEIAVAKAGARSRPMASNHA
jgi:tetratricopeptide (TPR) repeat protein